MASMTNVNNHLGAISQGAHLISSKLNSSETIEGNEFLELMRHVHGAIEELSKLVQAQARG
jgi:hypothetical protein